MGSLFPNPAPVTDVTGGEAFVADLLFLDLFIFILKTWRGKGFPFMGRPRKDIWNNSISHKLGKKTQIVTLLVRL